MAYQDDVRKDELTGGILDRAVEVHTELGSDQSESTYRNALEFALDEDGFDVETEHPFAVTYRDREVGEGRADMLVDGAVVLELKVVRAIRQTHFQQLARTVRQVPVTRGLLLNFGQATLEVRRYVNNFDPDDD